MPARDRAAHVQPGQAGHSAPVHSRRVRRHGRRRLRRVLRLRGDGADRPGSRHRRAGDLPRQRSDHGRRHSGAEEALADAHRRRGSAVRLRRHRAGSGQRSGRAADHGGARHGGRPRSSATRSTAASSGSATAASPTPTRFWPIRRAARAGSSWKRARRASRTTSRRTSTASALSNTAALVVQRRLRRCRPADRRRRRPGTDPGAGGVRLHAPDGGGVRAGRRAGRRSIARFLIPPSAFRPARRSRRSRATRTS